MTGSDARLPIAADALALLEGEEGRGRQRFLNHRRIRLPMPGTVRIDGDRVEWQLDNVWHDSMDGLLAQFLELRRVESAPDRVLRFASVWGGFAICCHGLPKGHGPTDIVTESCPNFVDYDLESVAIDAWRVFAQQAWLLLKLAGGLQVETSGAPEDWAALAETWAQIAKLSASKGPIGFDGMCRRFAESPEPLIRQMHLESGGDRLGDESLEVADMLSTWLTYGGVTPYVHWTEPEPKITLGGSGLFGALAIELVWVAMNRARATALCSACGTLYEPKRRPRARDKHYCTECRDKQEPGRQASAAWKAREKDKQRERRTARKKSQRVRTSKRRASSTHR